jgi:hypothetical protein
VRRGTAAKLSAAIPNATADVVMEAVGVAENFGLDQFWVGDPAGGNKDTADDRYVMTTIAAAAARTRDLRFGAFLSKVTDPDLLTDAELLHVAEDLSVIDQASSGRLEAGFVPRGDAWVERLELLLSLWTDGWEVGDGRVIAVTPPPAQPTLPRLIVSDDIATATRLGAGRVVGADGTVEEGVRGRTVLLKPLDSSVRGWLEGDPVKAIEGLREEIEAVRANQVLFALGTETVEDDLRALGTIAGPCVRCARHDVKRIAPDAWDWFREGAATAQEPAYFAEISVAFAKQP